MNRIRTLLVLTVVGVGVACGEQATQVATPDASTVEAMPTVNPMTDATPGLPGAIELPNSGLSFVGSGPSPRDVCKVTSVEDIWKWELKGDSTGTEYGSGTRFIGPDPYDSISSALGAFPDTLKKAKFVPKTKKDSEDCEYAVGFLNFTVRRGVVESLFPTDTIPCNGQKIYTDFDAISDDCLVTQMDVEWDVTRIYQALDVVASMPWQYGKPWYEATSGATVTADYVGGWPGATLTYSWTISNKSNRTGSGDIVSNCASSTASTCVVTFDIDDCGTFDIEVEITDGTTTATDTRTVTVYNCSPPTPSVFGPSLINYNGQTCGYFGSASGGVAPYSGPVWDGLSSGVNGWSTTLTGGPGLAVGTFDLEFSITDDMGRVATTAYNVDHDMTNSQPLCPT